MRRQNSKGPRDSKPKADHKSDRTHRVSSRVIPERKSVNPVQAAQIPKSWRAIVGTHAIAETMKLHPQGVQLAWLKQNFETIKELRDLELELRNRKVKIELKSDADLERLARTHQGAALFSSFVPKLDWERLYSLPKAKIILLDGIEDPHNLGAILRTAWLMGVEGLLIPQDRSVGLTPSVHKVASGGAEHVPVEIVGSFSNSLESLKKNGFWVYGLSHLGKAKLFDLKLPDKIVWAIGAEDKGLRTTTERLCDELVQIPQMSAAASYNASVAAAIALTETCRQLGI